MDSFGVRRYKSNMNAMLLRLPFHRHSQLIKPGCLSFNWITGTNGPAEIEAARINPRGFEAREYHVGGSHTTTVQVSG